MRRKNIKDKLECEKKEEELSISYFHCCKQVFFKICCNADYFFFPKKS